MKEGQRRQAGQIDLAQGAARAALQTALHCLTSRQLQQASSHVRHVIGQWVPCRHSRLIIVSAQLPPCDEVADDLFHVQP